MSSDPRDSPTRRVLRRLLALPIGIGRRVMVLLFRQEYASMFEPGERLLRVAGERGASHNWFVSNRAVYIYSREKPETLGRSSVTRIPYRDISGLSHHRDTPHTVALTLEVRDRPDGRRDIVSRFHKSHRKVIREMKRQWESAQGGTSRTSASDPGSAPPSKDAR